MNMQIDILFSFVYTNATNKKIILNYNLFSVLFRHCRFFFKMLHCSLFQFLL
jgi:hypothetical protein